MILSNKQITKALIRLRGCVGWLRLCCSQTPEDRFSRGKVQFYYSNAGPIYRIKTEMKSRRESLLSPASIYNKEGGNERWIDRKIQRYIVV